MSTNSTADPAGGPCGPDFTAARRQRSLQRRARSNQHPPQTGPWSEYDDSAASEVFRHHSPVLNHDRNLDRDYHRGYREFSHTLQPAISPEHPHESIAEVPLLSPIPISPRWDPSFTTASSPVQEAFNQTTQRTRTDFAPTQRATPRSAFPGLSSNPYIPEQPSSPPLLPSQGRKFPLLIRQNDVERPPLTPTSTISSADSRPGSRQTASTERSMTVENFSRPRKPSVRHREPPPSLRQPPTSHPNSDPTVDQPATSQTQFNYGSHSTPGTSTRRLSLSSEQSSSTFPSIRHRPSNDHLNATAARAPSLRRTSPGGSLTGNLANQTLSPNKNAGQALNREIPLWVTSDDELRSSFRSQLTASTAQGTLFTATGTERSSVLTGTSSITEHSIINGYARMSWRTNSVADDGPSVEDVMGMYERGFNDSDIESIRRSMRFAEEDEDTPDIRVPHDAPGLGASRPTSSHSDTSGMGAKMLEAMNDHLPIPGAMPVPESRRSSARYSGANFRLSLLPNSLPKDMGFGLATSHFAKRKDLETNGLGKHDSAKMLDRDDDDQLTQRAGSNPVSPTLQAPARSNTDSTVEDAPESRPVTPTPLAQYPIEPPEEPGSRDRYGFRKASANVTRAQYDAWDAPYTEYLARRRKKWVAFLKDNSLMTDNPNRFPSRNAKTKRFIRKGIPPDWRGAAWFYYAGGPSILSKHRGVYQALVKRAGLEPHGPGMVPGSKTEVKPLVVEDIEKDLHRTFPDNVRFKPPQPAPSQPLGEDGQAPLARMQTGPEPEIIGSLRRVLHAFALYNPRIGYCQSLNFLAGMLLLFVETEEQAFWLLNIITRVYLPGTHEMSLEGSKVDLGVLMLALKDSLPNVWKQIGGDEVEPTPAKKSRTRRGNKSANGTGGSDPNRLPAITLCMTAWFMSCFIGTLPTETVLRVWDVFFYEGSRTLFRIALTIFKLAENDIKAVGDPMEMFGVVQTFPRRLIDCNALMEACYKRRNGIGHLSQEIVEAKRQERRDGIRKWKAAEAAAAASSNEARNIGTSPNPGSQSNAMAAGLDLAADLLEVRRKGTLFGRRTKDREQARAAEVM